MMPNLFEVVIRGSHRDALVQRKVGDEQFVLMWDRDGRRYRLGSTDPLDAWQPEAKAAKR